MSDQIWAIIVLGGVFGVPLLIALHAFWQTCTNARDRQSLFEACGWKYQRGVSQKNWWKLSLDAKQPVYFIEHEENGLKWRLESSSNQEANTLETQWSAPLGWKLETGVESPSLMHKLNDNALAFGALRWMVRREMKKSHGLEEYEFEETTDEDQRLMIEEMLRLSQTLRRTRPLSLRELDDFCIVNSLWREDAVREVFDSQFERDLASFAAKLSKANRKTFCCRLENERIVVRVSADLPAPLAIEMTQLGSSVAARARRFCGQETKSFNEAPLRRALQRLPASQRDELRHQSSQQFIELCDSLSGF